MSDSLTGEVMLQEWRRQGLLHREDGPAILTSDEELYFLHGNPVEADEIPHPPQPRRRIMPTYLTAEQLRSLAGRLDEIASLKEQQIAVTSGVLDVPDINLDGVDAGGPVAFFTPDETPAVAVLPALPEDD